jgi:hypothetical protein
MTTEAQLLMTLRDSLQHIKGMKTPSPYVQEQVKTFGAPIVKALQQNHGHDLADSIALMRPVINQLLQGE